MNTIEKIKLWINNHLILTFSLVAQILSVLLFLCTFCSDQLVATHEIKIPTLQTFPTYFILFISFSILSLAKPSTLGMESIKVNCLKYFLYALFDVEANFAMITAFQYTSPASIQLLDASIIPIVMLLSIILLKTKYQLFQYIGALITVMGAVALVFIDVKSDLYIFQKGKNPLVGDILVVLACILYAGSNVIAESVTGNNGYGELLFFQGLFGSVIVLFQGGFLEYHMLMHAEWETSSILLCVAFTFALVVFYLLTPLVIKHIKASGFNISLVTTDIYTVIYYAMAYGNLTLLYAVGGIVITLGCVVFNAQTLYTEFKNARRIPTQSRTTPNDPIVICQNV